MKNLVIAAGVLISTIGLSSCGAHGDDPGHAYMPDMYYSRAYETFGYNDVGGEYDTLKARGIFYNALPVEGTIARGDMLPYHLTDDSTGLKSADALKNPLDTTATTKVQMKEAERIYLINCGVCHGDKLDGNGPLPAGGAYPAAPANFTAPNIKAYSDGHYFYVITYGIRMMGSYASQLTPLQRWWIIKYIRSKQGGAGGNAAGASKDSTATAGNKTAAKPDSTKAGK